MCTEVPPAVSAAAEARGAPPKIHQRQDGMFCTGAPGFNAPTQPIAKVALFHYITRSREDFAVKRSRGGGLTKIRTWEEFDNFDECAPWTAMLRSCAGQRPSVNFVHDCDS